MCTVNKDQINTDLPLEHQAELKGFICESFAFQVPVPDFALAILKGLSHLAPHAHVLKLKNEDFSRDPATVGALNNDPLIANESQPTRTVVRQLFYDTAGSADKTLKLYEGHFHDLLNDIDKEKVMADIQNWTDARLSSN